MHNQQHPMAGQVITPAIPPLTGARFKVVDWADRVEDSVALVPGLVMAIRGIAHDLPNDGNWVYGQLSHDQRRIPRAFLIHQSEIEACSLQLSACFAEAN